ncbi:MAG TPA: carboxylesterase family protein [Gammaproteobacteria bacterium]|nr:carboxylesterase family protein [Gammaproteobacteria bacterium]
MAATMQRGGGSASGKGRMWLAMGLAALVAISSGQAAAQDRQADAKAAPQSPPAIEVTGGEIRGARSPNNDRIYVFKGIPYAADTGGKNRFHAPRPVQPWSGVRDATHLGNRCPAPEFPPPPFMQEEGQDLDTSPMSEDCLYLNVWTPGLDGAKRPVMVWFHGGGFTSGSGGSFRYDGTNLAAYQNVVLVTTNHRLNIFGYLNLAGLGNDDYADAANVGVLDMVQSLQWVRDNIAKFGGDPDNVTIFGQSGGGAKVTTLMAVPAAHGLFEKVIAESGLESGPGAPPPDPHSALAKLGVSADHLEQLADLSTAEVMKAMGSGRWGPWADGKIIPVAPFNGQAPAVSADVPLMTGWTLTETTFFSGPVEPLDDAALHARVQQLASGDAAAADRMIAEYKSIYPEAPNNRLYLSMAADRMMGRRAIDVAGQKAAQGGAPVYVYHFVGKTEVRNLMSPHTIDIAYAFDNLPLSTRTNGAVTAGKQALADLVSTAWANFARTGVPSAPGLPAWKPYASERPALMVLGPAPHMIGGSQGVLKVLAKH